MTAPARPPALRPCTCPRCGAAFGCGVDLPACACTRITLDAATRAALAQRYAGCLCPACLRAVAEGAR